MCGGGVQASAAAACRSMPQHKKFFRGTALAWWCVCAKNAPIQSIDAPRAHTKRGSCATLDLCMGLLWG